MHRANKQSVLINQLNSSEVYFTKKPS